MTRPISSRIESRDKRTINESKICFFEKINKIDKVITKHLKQMRTHKWTVTGIKEEYHKSS